MSLPEPIYFPYRTRSSNISIDHRSHFVGQPDWQTQRRTDATRANAFQEAVFRILSALNHPGTGGAVLRVIIRMSPRKLLVIRPSPTSNPDVAHAYVQGDTIYDGRDAFAPPQGTGQGAAVTNLFITPRHYGQHSDVQVTMLHELVHVVRSMTGQRADSQPVAGYENLEEYLATIVANVFCSERDPSSFAYGYQHRVGMFRWRGSYERDPFWRNIDDILTQSGRVGPSNFSQLSSVQAQEVSRRFVADAGHGALMRAFRASNPDLFQALAAVRRAAFNPMRDLSG